MTSIDSSVNHSVHVPRTHAGTRGASSSLASKLFGDINTRSLCCILVAVVVCLLPLDVPGLLLVAFGAAVAFFTGFGPPRKRKVEGHTKTVSWQPDEKKVAGPSVASVATAVVKTTSHQPVLIKSFGTAKFGEQVTELLPQLSPSTPQCLCVQQELGDRVKRLICEFLPEAQVSIFVSGDLGKNTAFALAVPDVEVVARLSPQVLFESLKRSGKAKCPILISKLATDRFKLQKFAVQKCTDALVKSGLFKFRRSAFSALESKVTLVAINVAGVDKVHLDFSVNYSAAVHNAALVAEIEVIDPRAKELVLLVRRWAKDRGICHASKGTLAPYAWVLMVVHFLQVKVRLLPPLQCQKLEQELSIRHVKAQRSEATQESSVAELLRGFFSFYVEEMDWDTEAVCVTGQRRAAEPSLRQHMMKAGDGTTPGPSFEDAFQPQSNVAASLHAIGWSRVKQELHRGLSITSSAEPQLADLLEPWVPEFSNEKSGDADQVENDQLLPSK